MQRTSRIPVLIAAVCASACAGVASAHAAPAQATVTVNLVKRLTAGDTETVKIRSLDQAGNAVPGQRLTVVTSGANRATTYVTTDKTGTAFYYFFVTHAGTTVVRASAPGGSPGGSNSVYVYRLKILNRLTVSSPRKGVVALTAKVDQPGNYEVNEQEMGFFQYIPHTDGRYAYRAEARIGTDGIARIILHRKSGTKLAFRSRIGNDPDLYSPFSPRGIVTVR